MNGLYASFAEELVTCAYQGILDRQPDPEGLKASSDALRGGHDLAWLLRSLIESPEFQRRQLTAHPLPAEQVVTMAYQALLQRDPDPDGLRLYSDGLQGGQDLVWLLRVLVESQEFYLNSLKTRRFQPFKPVCTLIRDRLRLWVDLYDRHVSRDCLAGEYEPSETAFILSNLKAGDTFIDIGANLGWFTILGADAVGSSGKVYAFEPRTEIYELLGRSVSDNGFESRCILKNNALGDKPGSMRLAWGENPGGTRLARPDEELPDHGFEMVEIITLDSAVPEPRVDLIKMDVEGAEPLVLKGATRFLERCRPTILGEILPRGIRQVSGMEVSEYGAFLHQLGYRIFQVAGGKMGPELVNLNEAELPEVSNVILVHESRLPA